MNVHEAGISTEVKASQLANAQSPIVVTDGIETDVKAEQSKNALLPIVVAFGISTDVKAEQSKNALLPIVVTEYVPPSYVTSAGMTTSPE